MRCKSTSTLAIQTCLSILVLRLSSNLDGSAGCKSVSLACARAGRLRAGWLSLSLGLSVVLVRSDQRAAPEAGVDVWRRERLAQGCAFRSPSNQRSHTTTPATTYLTILYHTTHLHTIAAGNYYTGTLTPFIVTTTPRTRPSLVCDTTPLSRRPSSDRRCELPVNHLILIQHHGRCRCHDLQRLRRIVHRGQHPFGFRRRCKTLRDHRFAGPQTGRLLYHDHAPTTPKPKSST